MNLLFYTAGDNSAAWVDALARALPEASLATWPDVAPGAVDYALVWKPPAAMLAELGSAKAIFNLGAGVDSLSGSPERPPRVPLIRLEDAGMAEQMGEYVTHAVLHWYREFDAYAQSQRAVTWEPRRRLDKRAFGVGLLGLGVLGAAVARVLAPLGFPLRGWSRSLKDLPGVESFAGVEALPAFLSGSRVLVCLLPLTSETRGIMNRHTLSRLLRDAYVVNVARGPLLVDDDLIELIDTGHITGAMLDVFHDEPLPASHAFWHDPRIKVTPHVSAVTLVEDSVAQIARKIRLLEAGLPVSGVVDDARMY